MWGTRGPTVTDREPSRDTDVHPRPHARGRSFAHRPRVPGGVRLTRGGRLSAALRKNTDQLGSDPC